MKKRLDLILNGKGGVGKSFFAVNFIQYLKDHSIKHVAIDTDNENSTLKRFHPESVFVDLSQASGIDRIFVEVSAHPLVVVDYARPAQHLSPQPNRPHHSFPRLERTRQKFSL
jgi:cellulose biosynthesis protein BcsQ